MRFLFQVARVFHGYFRLLRHSGGYLRPLRPEFCQVLQGDFRPFQQIFRLQGSGRFRLALFLQQAVQFLSRCEAGGFQLPDQIRCLLPFPQGPLQPFLRGQAGLVADLRQPQVRVILPQVQPVFRPGGHHPVRFIRSLGGQIVCQHADVRHVPGQQDLFPSLQLQGGVHAGQQALAGRFLISAGTVDLSGKEQSADAQAFQRRPQFQRVNAVIFNRVAQPGKVAVPQSRDCPVHFPLHVLRHGGAHALHIPFPAFPTFRFQEDLVPVLVRKPDHFIFDARAVPWADAVDFAAVQRCPVQVVQDDFVRFRRGPGQIAAVGVLQLPVCQEGEGHHRIVAFLFLHLVKVDGSYVHPGRGAGFVPAQGKAQLRQAGGKLGGVHQALGAAVMPVFADDDASLQVNTGGYHHRPARDPCTGHRCHRRHQSVFRLNGGCFALPDRQPVLGH